MTRLPASLLLAPLLVMPAATALAHHPMDGVAPTTMGQGLLSGLAHPILGLDHLAFVIAAGLILSAAPRLGARALIGFLAAMVGGALLHRNGVGFGPVEAMVAGSAILAGLVLLTLGRAPRIAASALAIPVFAVAGLVHGHALAEAAIGSPAPVFALYLGALAASQAGIALAAMFFARRLNTALPLRAAGLAAACVGLVFMLA